MFPLTFHFHDSEVKHIRQEQHTVRVLFSAARVHSAAPTHVGFDGYALGLELQLIGVMGQAAVSDRFGRLSSGSISVGGPPRSSLMLPGLPFEWKGQTTVALAFSQRENWIASALRVHLNWENGVRFSDGVGC
jgi:hypothetical protein